MWLDRVFRRNHASPLYEYPYNQVRDISKNDISAVVRIYQNITENVRVTVRCVVVRNDRANKKVGI